MTNPGVRAVPGTPAETLTVGHVTITAKGGGRIDGSCSFCGTGIDVGPTFGPIPGETLILEWAKQHTHLPKTSRAKPSRARR